MLTNELSVTYNGTSETLRRVNQDNFGSTYWKGFSSPLADGVTDIKLTIRHTIPARDKGGESHLVRLDVTYVDADGNYSHTASAWVVVKTIDKPQNLDNAVDTAVAALGFLTSASSDIPAETHLMRAIGRES